MLIDLQQFMPDGKKQRLRPLIDLCLFPASIVINPHGHRVVDRESALAVVPGTKEFLYYHKEGRLLAHSDTIIGSFLAPNEVTVSIYLSRGPTTMPGESAWTLNFHGESAFGMRLDGSNFNPNIIPNNMSTSLSVWSKLSLEEDNLCSLDKARLESTYQTHKSKWQRRFNDMKSLVKSWK